MRPHLTAPRTVFAWAAARFDGAPAALVALDAQLAEILRTTTQPLVGHMRLTWWHDALERLDGAVPDQPVLRALATDVLSHGVRAGALARIVEGWEALLEEPLDAAAVTRHGLRGEALFGALAEAQQIAGTPALFAAGRGWALVDLAAHLSDPVLAEHARDAATVALKAAFAGRWNAGRMLGALALDARMALGGQGAAGGPRRAMRVLRFVTTGR